MSVIVSSKKMPSQTPGKVFVFFSAKKGVKEGENSADQRMNVVCACQEIQEPVRGLALSERI